MVGEVGFLPLSSRHALAMHVLAALREQRLRFEVMTLDELVRVGARRPAMAVGATRTPGADALQALRTARSLELPTLLVVDQLTENDEVALLHAGAYDVLPGTASRRLIGARLRTMFNHVHHQRPLHTPYQFENVTVRPDSHEVFVAHQPVVLTRTEFQLLLLLMIRPDTVVYRDTLAEQLGRGHVLSPRALESHVSRLRQKVLAAGGPRLIRAVRGSGYQLRADR